MYNATAYELKNDGETVLAVSVVEIKDGHIVRGNSWWCSGLTGSPEYEDRWLDHCTVAQMLGGQVKIFLDDCAGYRNALRGPAIPKHLQPIKTISFAQKN